jgi:hypothetical protein
MRQRIDMDALWRSALRVAEAALTEHGQELDTRLAGHRPVTLDELLAENFAFRDVVRQIAQPGP